MPLQLMKIRIEATSSVETGPQPQKFFHVTTTQTDPDATLTIEVDNFFTDTGDTATELPALATGNSWYNVYVNGVLQMEGLTRYTPGTSGTGQLEIDVPDGGEPILAGTAVVLEVVNFVPSSTITVNT
jgi:hypothetical protein